MVRGLSSRVIKKCAPDAEPVTTGPDEVLSAANERARQIVSDAHAQAAAIREGIEAEAQRARLEARAAGHAEGVALAAAALARCAAVREARLADAEGAVIDVALEIARQIVGRELAAAPEAVVDVARRALRAAAGTGDVRLRVAAADLAAIGRAEGALGALVDRGTLAVVEDPGLRQGEVVVEAEGGRVDARIAAQLEAFRKALEAEER